MSLFAGLPDPVIVYQMGKVGSTAVVQALEGQGLPVFQVHRMSREHLTRMREDRRAHGWYIPPVLRHDRLGLLLCDRVVHGGRRARIVTLVREPIARNLSSYFENLETIWHSPEPHRTVPLQDLVRGFHERFTHEEPLTWFDDEMLPVLGIDVYDQPFPSAGVGTIRTDRFDVLILKSESSDETKSAALSKFFGIDVRLARVNETGVKPKGEAFRQFAAAIRLSPAYVETMLNARYTRHFYDEAEREALRRRYLDVICAGPASH